MKIGIDIRMLGNRHGGIGRYVFELVKNIVALDTQNTYILFYHSLDADQKDLLPFLGHSNVTLVSAPFRHYSLMEQTNFLRLLNSHRLDLMHFPNFNVPLMYKRPYVVTIHDMVHHKISGAKKSHLVHFWAYKKVIENAAHRSKRVITVSEYSKKDIASYLQVPLEKISVVYEGTSLSAEVSTDRVDRVRARFLLHRPYFLFVGVLERKKNIKSLTRGLDVLLKKYRHDIDLVLAGKEDKHYPEVKYKALDIKYRDHLVFTGYVSDEELSALYRGAHAFVSASLHEGFGLPGVEAMKFGLPLAVSNLEVFNEVYDNAAIYFNPLDPEDIAEKLHLLAQDVQFHQQLQVNSLRRSELFDWGKAAEETIEIYRQVI